MAAINTSLLRLDDVFCTSNGSKICRLCDGDSPLVLMPEMMRSPFNAGTFDRDPHAKRLNLQLAIDDPSLLSSLQAFDEWMIDYVTEHSERLFKRAWTREQVKLGYVAVVRQPAKEGHSPLLKAKFDTEGRYALVCWNPNDERVLPIEDWTNAQIRPRLHFSHLWIMGSQFGAVVRLTDAKILNKAQVDAVRTCPFQ